MPHLAFDLDAKKRVPLVARAAEVEPGAIAWGLLEMWEHAWTAKVCIVSEVVLDGCFGRSERIRQALEAYGFIERVEGGWRVRGAERYLRISEARSRGGKKASGNLKRGNRQPGKERPTASPSPGSVPAQAGKQPGLNPGPTSIIDHRSSDLLPSEADPLAGAAAQQPAPPRRARKRTREDPPPDPRHAPMVKRLCEAFERETGARYEFEPKHAAAVARLLEHDPDELERRWLASVRAAPRWPGTRDLCVFVSRWNEFAGAAPGTGPPRDVRRGRVAAEDVPQDAFARTGDITDAL